MSSGAERSRGPHEELETRAEEQRANSLSNMLIEERVCRYSAHLAAYSTCAETHANERVLQCLIDPNEPPLTAILIRVKESHLTSVASSMTRRPAHSGGGAVNSGSPCRKS